MKYLAAVVLFATIALGALDNPTALWQVRGVDDNGIYKDASSLIFSLPKNTPVDAPAEVSYKFEPQHADIEKIHWIVNDSFAGQTCGYITFGVRINGKTVQTADVCDMSGQENEYTAENGEAVKVIEVYARVIKAVSNFAVSISWDALYVDTKDGKQNIISSDYTNYAIAGKLPKDLPLVCKPVMDEQWLKDAVIFQPWGVYEYQIFYKNNPSLESICGDFGINAIALQPWPDFMRYGYEDVSEDDFIKLLERCRKLGLKIILYSSIMHQGHGPQWQNGILEKEHPEWSQRDKNGKPITIYGHEWLCPSTGALDFTLDYTKSLISKYGGDAVMLDNNEFLSTDGTENGVTCYCLSCRDGFREYVLKRFDGKYGDYFNIAPDKLDIPSGRCDLYNLWIHWRNITWAKGLAKYREQINIPVFANTQYHYKNYYLATDLQYDCQDAVFSESGSLAGPSAIGAKMLLGGAISPDKPLINYMGTFVKGVKPVVLRPPYESAAAVAATIAYNAKPWLLWHGMGEKESSRQSYEMIQSIMKFHSVNRGLYKDLKAVGKTAVLLSPQSRNYCDKPLIPQAVYDMQLSGIALRGLWQNYLNEQIDCYDVIAAQNVCSISDEHIEAVKEWIKKGGILITTPDFAQFDEIGRRRENIPLDGLNFEKGRVVKLSQVSEFRAAIERFSANDRFRAASGLEIRPYLNNEGLVLHIIKHGQEAVPQGSKITLPRSMRDDYKNCTFYSPQSQQTPLIYDKSSGMLSGIPQMGIYSVIKCN